MTANDRPGGVRDPFETPENEAAGDVVPGGPVVRVLAVTCLGTVLLCGIAYFVLVSQETRYRPSLQFPEARLPPPTEVSNVRQWMFAGPRARPSLAERKRKMLERYTWVDERRRIVSIPIERAMDLVVREHQGGEGRAR